MYHAIMSHSKKSKLSTQVLVRLPPDLAVRFASIVPSRNRSRFLIQLLRRELERESEQLSAAARRLTELESRDAASETQDWIGATLVQEVDDFDAEEFTRQFRAAQANTKPE